MTKIKKIFKEKCYKIFPIWTGNPKAGLEFDFNFQLQFEFFNTSVNVKDAFKESAGRIYPTSEENSYGLTIDRWFDGKTESVPLKANTIYDIYEVNEFMCVWIGTVLMIPTLNA